MTTDAIRSVWVFNGEGARFPSGVFTSRDLAGAWIERNRLSGILTEYPLDVGVFEWAVQNGLFLPKPAHEQSPKFIGGFTSAHMDHVHFEAGVVASGG
jgi:hypothetical protein